MSDYNHLTRECSIQQLRPDLAAVIRAHIEKHELGSLETQALICCETIS